jgi:hypothetical protein
MLILLRILFGAGLVYGFRKTVENAEAAPNTGDLTNAFYLAFSVIMSIANAVVWAPYLGEKLSDPLTSVLTKGNFADRKNQALRLIRRLDSRRYRRLTSFLCFLEGIRHPDWPTAFVIGLKNTRPGSWLEKVYAFEVFRFDNAQHCVDAYHALKRHGIDPRPHHNPEISMVLISLEHAVKADPKKVVVPPAPEPPPLKRDTRIRLFESSMPAADHAAVSPATRQLEEVDSAPEPVVDPPGTVKRVEEAKDTHADWSVLSRIKAFLRGG